MKNIILVLFFVLISFPGKAQVYAQYDLGIAFNSSHPLLTNLHIGYQFNEILTPNGVVMVEYNQRLLMEQLSNVYFGGRAGYGVNTGHYTTLAAWGNYYFKLVSGDNKQLNYWVPGYGISFSWKNISANVDYVEFVQASIGCYYLFD